MERPKKGRANSVEKIVLDKEHGVLEVDKNRPSPNCSRLGNIDTPPSNKPHVGGDDNSGDSDRYTSAPIYSGRPTQGGFRPLHDGQLVR
jgi:hypothetical protein